MQSSKVSEHSARRKKELCVQQFRYAGDQMRHTTSFTTRSLHEVCSADAVAHLGQNLLPCNQSCRESCIPAPLLCQATDIQMLTSSLLRPHRTPSSLNNSGKLFSLLIRLTRLSKGHHCMMYKHPSADRTMSGFASGKLLLEPTLLLICKSGGTGRQEMLCWVCALDCI